MRWSVPIGRVLGIRLQLHFTFLLFIGWVGYIGFREEHWLGAFVAVALIVVMFGIILLHELGHSIAAMRYGVQVPTITLLPIGGVASLSAIPEVPRQEFIIAVAGPAVNAIIAIPLAALCGWWWPSPDYLLKLDHAPNTVVEFIHVMNLRLLAFNLIPAFPMDGGRVLRALLASVISYDRATMIASLLGRVIALFFICSGPVFHYLGWSWSPILTLIGVFVFFGAGHENRWVKLRARLRGRVVGEIVRPISVVLGPQNRLSDILAVIHRVPQVDFPIFDDGRVVGVLSRDRWLDAAATRYDDPPLYQLMQPHFSSIRPNMDIARLIYDRKLAQQSLFPVMENGRILGYATRDDIDDVLRRSSPRPSAMPPPLPRNRATVGV